MTTITATMIEGDQDRGIREINIDSFQDLKETIEAHNSFEGNYDDYYFSLDKDGETVANYFIDLKSKKVILRTFKSMGMYNKKKKIKEIAVEILTTECTYKYGDRSGWICGLGNGIVAYIEDHRNELSLKVVHYCNSELLKAKGFISDVFNGDIIIKKVIKGDFQQDFPDKNLMMEAKERSYFGYPIAECEITEVEIDEAIKNEKEWIEKRRNR